MNVPQDVEGPVNLGNPVEMTMSELAELVITLTGSRSRIEFRPLPQDDPRQRRPDISRARQLLHWTPIVPLEDGLNRTIAYFDNLLANPCEVNKLVWQASS
jgi:UDP-glucuronate decarboxylase